MSYMQQIIGDRLTLFNALEDSILENDEYDEEIVKLLEINEEDFIEKMKSNFHLIEYKKHEIQMNNDQIEALTKTNKQLQKVIDKVKELSLEGLKSFGEQTKTGGYRLKIPGLSIYTGNTTKVVVDKNFDDEDYIIKNVNLKLSIEDYKNLLNHLPKESVELLNNNSNNVLDLKGIKTELKYRDKLPEEELSELPQLEAELVKKDHIVFRQLKL